MACRITPKKAGILEGVFVDLDGNQPPGEKPPTITAEEYIMSKFEEYLQEKQSAKKRRFLFRRKRKDKGKGKAPAGPDHHWSSNRSSTQFAGCRPGPSRQPEKKNPQKEFRMEIPAARRYTPLSGGPSSSRMSAEIPNGRPKSRLRFEVKLDEEESETNISKGKKPAVESESSSSLENPFTRDDRLESGSRCSGRCMAGGRGERDWRATYNSKSWKDRLPKAKSTAASFVAGENVHPGHMVSEFGFTKRESAIQTLDLRHESALTAIQEERKRRNEVRERRRIKALGRGEIPWDSEGSSSSEDHILDSSDMSSSDAASLRSLGRERSASPPVPTAQSTRESTGAQSVGSPVKTLSPLQKVEILCRRLSDVALEKLEHVAALTKKPTRDKKGGLKISAPLPRSPASDENYTDGYYGARQRVRIELGNSASSPTLPQQRPLAQSRYTPYQQFSTDRPPPIYEELENTHKDDSEDSLHDRPEDSTECDTKEDIKENNSLTLYEHQPRPLTDECEIALEQPEKDPPLTFFSATVSWLPIGIPPSPKFPLVNPVACTLGLELQFDDSTDKGMIPQHPAIHIIHAQRRPNPKDQIFLTISAPGSEKVYCKVNEDYVFFLAELNPPPKVAEILSYLVKTHIITKTGVEVGKERFQQYKVMLFLSNICKKCSNCEKWEALAPNPRYIPETGINRHYYRRLEVCSCKVAWFCNRDCMLEAWNDGVHHEVCLDMRGLQHENLEQYRRRYHIKQAQQAEEMNKIEEAEPHDMQK
ncbi:hypothetical protein BZA77DRAFT_370883 [Pyronema omphalodes]|nr:hypothetical protein BZA77DRAFT_370883 [Pyronema omphalodes]